MNFHPRASYRFTVETTVYVAEAHLGKGLGADLYAPLLEELRGGEFHCAVAGIALPNPASIALHERFGFEKVAEFQSVGYKFGDWIDVGYWELIL